MGVCCCNHCCPYILQQALQLFVGGVRVDEAVEGPGRAAAAQEGAAALEGETVQEGECSRYSRSRVDRRPAHQDTMSLMRCALGERSGSGSGPLVRRTR